METLPGRQLKDFYSDFLVPVGEWVLGKGLPDFVDALNKGLMNIDYSKINDALKELWKALAPFAINVAKPFMVLGECSGSTWNMDGK